MASGGASDRSALLPPAEARGPIPAAAIARRSPIPHAANAALPSVVLFGICPAAISRREFMADHMPAGPVDTGANMDYSEHERTYRGFLSLTKYASLTAIAVLVAMAFSFFFPGGGFFSGAVLFAVIMVAGYFIIR